MGMIETVIPNSLETALECILKKAENPKTSCLLTFGFFWNSSRHQGKKTNKTPKRHKSCVSFTKYLPSASSELRENWKVSEFGSSEMPPEASRVLGDMKTGVRSGSHVEKVSKRGASIHQFAVHLLYVGYQC